MLLLLLLMKAVALPGPPTATTRGSTSEALDTTRARRWARTRIPVKHIHPPRQVSPLLQPGVTLVHTAVHPPSKANTQLKCSLSSSSSAGERELYSPPGARPRTPAQRPGHVGIPTLLNLCANAIRLRITHDRSPWSDTALSFWGGKTQCCENRSIQ